MLCYKTDIREYIHYKGMPSLAWSQQRGCMWIPTPCYIPYSPGTITDGREPGCRAALPFTMLALGVPYMGWSSNEQQGQLCSCFFPSWNGINQMEVAKTEVEHFWTESRFRWDISELKGQYKLSGTSTNSPWTLGNANLYQFPQSPYSNTFKSPIPVHRLYWSFCDLLPFPTVPFYLSSMYSHTVPLTWGLGYQPSCTGLHVSHLPWIYIHLIIDLQRILNER